MGRMAAPGSVFQAPLTSARTEGGARGPGSQALWYHVILTTTTRLRAAVSFTHFRDKEAEAQPSRGRAGRVPLKAGERASGSRLGTGVSWKVAHGAPTLTPSWLCAETPGSRSWARQRPPEQTTGWQT